ncbi:hypothetical protein ACJMK2_010515 [Sinanodonta woodiana]|uniref:Uncharacterized protein n=1 Tax=Sinanodonta woodiana TaxID=1069815 RepID=A0ABD3VFN0_SINWO
MHYIPGAGFVKSSMFRPRSYSPTYFRRSYTYDDDALIYPVHIPRKNFIDTSAEENYLRSHVNKELYVSGAALEDTFDLASQSRNRDQQLLSKAHKAIVNTQLHSSPRYAVVSRRAARSQSVPPSDLHRKVVKERLASPKRPIRDAGGYTNPNNILSWQYKLLARISPDAMLSQPVSFNKMRDQMREVQDKMDRQKQLLDRYMPIDSDLKLEGPRI